MAQVAPVLFKGYSVLRRTAPKLRHAKNWENWCLPLAGLLCSSAPEDELRKSVVNMGDEFVSKGWIYAAHICYVLARMELGLRHQFHLIGCDGLNVPHKNTAKREAIERTEVYEYLLSLTSGSGQIVFQEFKFLHAYMLAKAGLHVQALEYCEIIATMVLRFPRCVSGGTVKVAIELCEKLLQQKKEKEPEWLLKFQQLLQDGSDFSSSGSLDSPEFHPSDHDEFDSRYTMGEMLGRGGFGSVYAGVRKADGKKVAIKFVLKYFATDFLTIPGETDSLPMEVALMKMVSTPTRCDNVVELLDWFETSESFIMVLERPDPCMDLAQFKRNNNRRVPESVARKVMRQVVQATRHCSDRGVFHSDIKCANILINPDTLEVKLIDFGCGNLLTDEPFMSYAGTPYYWPPEWVLDRKYFVVPATIWSLGLVLFDLVCGTLPFNSDEEITKGCLKFAPDVSTECRGLIKWCLDKEPEGRPSFDGILRHDWFKEGCETTV
ncbi:serine/threonine-protein kinase pim-1-like [Hemibagrus wyckioides]|uniref:serine/threonine-protein kinase pim-1-like n=1 Tax=Hemibagrus wyckioides TaxID=337641 RepID=UPI00266C78C7|nr:serine/threonine-protein kinase pim-1-like [Hemibagrus wyckioides]